MFARLSYGAISLLKITMVPTFSDWQISPTSSDFPQLSSIKLSRFSSILGKIRWLFHSDQNSLTGKCSPDFARFSSSSVNHKLKLPFALPDKILVSIQIASLQSVTFISILSYNNVNTMKDITDTVNDVCTTLTVATLTNGLQLWLHWTCPTW